MVSGDLQGIAKELSEASSMLQMAAVKMYDLEKQVEYWQHAYHKAQDQVERLSLDLGFRNGHSGK